MSIDIGKEELNVNKLIAEKKELIFIHNDIIVPDSKPDVLNVINTNGNVCIYKKEAREGKVKIDGSIKTYIMYLPDSKNDNLRALNCSLEFSENIQVPNVKENMTLFIKPIIKDIECKVLNGRKISIKAGIEFDIKVYSSENISIIEKINNIEDIQIMPQEYKINSLIGNKSTIVYAKDTINIDSEEEFAEILRIDINIINQDYKISYNKVLAKADLKIKIIYLTEENKVKKVEGILPVVGFIDIPNISENNICDINYCIKNMSIKPNQASEHSIYVEFEIEIIIMVYEQKLIKIIQDLYSPTSKITYIKKRILLNSKRLEKENNIKINEKINVPSLTEEGLIDLEIKPIILNTQITNEKINYNGEINLNFVFTEDNGLVSKTAKIPFKTSIENELKTDKINLEDNIVINDYEININRDKEVEITTNLGVNTKINNNIMIDLIENIEKEAGKLKEGDYDSLILYIVKPEDTLWKIAKKFNSTVEDIVKINDIKDKETLSIGQKIYIPKFKPSKKI